MPLPSVQLIVSADNHVQLQDERSQLQNRQKAMRVLRSRIFEAERQRKQAERSATRLAQIGRAERSERVRTFNFSQNRVTDHRINLSKCVPVIGVRRVSDPCTPGTCLCIFYLPPRFDMDAMMRGELLDEFIDGLIAADEEEGLLAVLHAAEAKPPPSSPPASHAQAATAGKK
jgi:hypothetical protein